MPEVAERREPHAAVARARAAPGAGRTPPSGTGTARRGRTRTRSRPPASVSSDVDGDDELPVEPAGAVDEVRRRAAERQRADEHAERDAAVLAKPRRHQLQRRRIDAGEEEPGREARGQRAARPGRPRAAPGSPPRRRPRRRGSRAAARRRRLRFSTLETSAPATKPSCTAIVSQAARRAREIPLGAQLRDDRRRREPRRHREHERDREQRERAAAPGVRAARSRRARCRRGRPCRPGSLIVVRSFVIGLSSRTSSTSTSAVISSPGRTGARKLQSTCRKTLPGPGQVLGDDRVEQARRHAALDDDPAEARARGRLLVVVERVAVAGQLGEQLDVAVRDGAAAAGGVTDSGHVGSVPRLAGTCPGDCPSSATAAAATGAGPSAPCRRSGSGAVVDRVLLEVHAADRRAADAGTARRGAVDAVDVASPLPASRSSRPRSRSSSIAAASRSTSSAREIGRERERRELARQRISFACARPMPASARWSRSSGVQPAASAARISPSRSAPSPSASGPRCASSASAASGVSSQTPAPLLRAGLGEHELAAVLEAEPEHRRLRRLRPGREVAQPPGAHQVDAQDELAVLGGEEQVLARAGARPRSRRPSSVAQRRVERLHGRDVRRPGLRDRATRDERVELAHPRLDFG